MKECTKLLWQVHVHDLMEEIITANEANGEAVRIPINIMWGILGEVAKRATEINDPEMNKLMIRLGLYSISDPHSPEYNPKLVKEILYEGRVEGTAGSTKGRFLG